MLESQHQTFPLTLTLDNNISQSIRTLPGSRTLQEVFRMLKDVKEMSRSPLLIFVGDEQQDQKESVSKLVRKYGPKALVQFKNISSKQVMNASNRPRIISSRSLTFSNRSISDNQVNNEQDLQQGRIKLTQSISQPKNTILLYLQYNFQHPTPNAMLTVRSQNSLSDLHPLIINSYSELSRTSSDERQLTIYQYSPIDDFHYYVEPFSNKLHQKQLKRALKHLFGDKKQVIVSIKRKACR